MAKHVRIVACLFLLTLLLGLSARPDPAQAANASDELIEMELEHAVALGFTRPEDPDQIITGKELTPILDHFIELANASKSRAWKHKYTRHRNSDLQMTRSDVLAACFLAANLAGKEYTATTTEEHVYACLYAPLSNQSWPRLTAGLFDEQHSGEYYDIGYGNMALDYTAMVFNLSRRSPYSGDFPFAFNVDKSSWELSKPATRAEALLAVVRVYDAAHPEMTKKADQAAFQAIFNAQVMKAGKAFPKATAEKHPYWTGFQLYWEYYRENAHEKALHDIAKWGFNCVRIYINYDLLFDRDVKTMNYTNWRKLDRRIAQCMQEGLHVNLCTNTLPGYETKMDADTYEMSFDYSLFTDKQQQKKADKVWKTIAERYKDIPAGCLSFSPFFECGSGIIDKVYTEKQLTNYIHHLTDAIQVINAQHIVMYELTGTTDGVSWQAENHKRLSDLSNAMMVYNYAQDPFIFWNCQLDPLYGNVDDIKTSMYAPTYPQYVYSLYNTVTKDRPLEMDGFLPKGTEITVYLEKSEKGKAQILLDGKKALEQSLKKQEYKISQPLSQYFPYSTSKKTLKITLTKAAKKIRFTAASGSWTWCGMDVKLPGKYAVQRVFNVTEYDAKFNGMGWAGNRWQTTSTVQIAPSNRVLSVQHDLPDDFIETHVTINKDVTYSTPSVYCQASAKHTDRWIKEIRKLEPKCLVRCEGAGSLHVWNDVQKYYDTVFSRFKKNQISWLSNDYEALISGGYFGAKSTSGNGYEKLHTDMLKLFQKYQ